MADRTSSHPDLRDIPVRLDQARRERLKKFRGEAAARVARFINLAGVARHGLVDCSEINEHVVQYQSRPLWVPATENLSGETAVNDKEQVMVAGRERRKVSRGLATVALSLGVGMTAEEAWQNKVRVTPESYMSSASVELSLNDSSVRVTYGWREVADELARFEDLFELSQRVVEYNIRSKEHFVLLGMAGETLDINVNPQLLRLPLPPDSV